MGPSNYLIGPQQIDPPKQTYITVTCGNEAVLLG